VFIQKWLFSAISASNEDFNPQNTLCIPAVKIFVFLDLAENISFLDEHKLVSVYKDVENLSRTTITSVMIFFKSGLRSQIILNLIVLMVITVGLISIATLKITASSILKQKIVSGNILVSSIQSSIDSIFRGDPDSFQKGAEGWRLARLVRSFGRESEFNSLFIVDRDHRVIANSVEGKGGIEIHDRDMDMAISDGEVITRFGKRDRWLSWGVGNELIISAPIYLGAKIVGGIRANLSLSDVQKSIMKTQKIIFLYIVFDSIVIIIFGGFLLSRSLVKPIKELLRATEKISDGDFSQKMKDRGINEIGKLSMSFNRMSRRLEGYVKSVEKANIELKQAQDEVIRSEKLASVGRLAAGVAHEIGNPIGAILGYVHILKGGVKDRKEEEDYLKRIETESSRINTIVRDLLDFSRPSQVEVREVEINKVIDSTVSLLSPQKVLRKIRVDLYLEEDLPSVLVDENQFQQVMINLIINASDAMPDGGDLTIQTGLTSTQGEGAGSLSQRRKGDPEGIDYALLRMDYTFSGSYNRLKAAARSLEVKVSDTGCGIREEDRPKIFDPFYTTKPPGKGTGLGLTTCLRIIESFNGHIKVESRETKGTTFTILLPVAECEQRGQVTDI